MDPCTIAPYASAKTKKKQKSKAKQELSDEFKAVLAQQSHGTFTFRCIDCFYDPIVCIKTMLLPCDVNAKISKRLEVGNYSTNFYMCLLAPCFIGSYYSVGKNKIMYRKAHSIPGLVTDDYLMGWLFPWCLMMQLENQLNEEAHEKKEMTNLQRRVNTLGQTIERE